MRISTLIWGRLDAGTASGLSVSLPEACRLSDALLSQLRVKLGLDPSGAEVTERVRQLRAQMERIREQIDLEPAGDRTKVTLTQAHLEGEVTEEDRRNRARFERNWATVLDGLEKATRQ